MWMTEPWATLLQSTLKLVFSQQQVVAGLFSVLEGTFSNSTITGKHNRGQKWSLKDSYQPPCQDGLWLWRSWPQEKAKCSRESVRFSKASPFSILTPKKKSHWNRMWCLLFRRLSNRKHMFIIVILHDCLFFSPSFPLSNYTTWRCPSRDRGDNPRKYTPPSQENHLAFICDIIPSGMQKVKC